MVDSCITHIEKEFGPGKILLVTPPGKDYRDCAKALAVQAAKMFKKACYVTMNDPSGLLAERLGADGKKLTFIDCVSSTVKKQEPRAGVTFVSSPHALTEISIAIRNALGEKSDFFIFDSLSAMLVYEQKLSVMKLVHSLVLSFREAKTSACFIMLKEDADQEMVKDLSMFVDKIIGLD